MFRFLCLLGLFLPIISRAETPEDLASKNAFPNEIIEKLNTPEPAQAAPPVQNVVQLGTVVSLYQHKDNPDLFDFTFSLPDNGTLTLTQENNLNLKPGDSVLISETDGETAIKRQVTTP